MSGILRGNCCETCHNIPQKTPVNGFTKKNFLKLMSAIFYQIIIFHQTIALQKMKKDFNFI